MRVLPYRLCDLFDDVISMTMLCSYNIDSFFSLSLSLPISLSLHLSLSVCLCLSLSLSLSLSVSLSVSLSLLSLQLVKDFMSQTSPISISSLFSQSAISDLTDKLTKLVILKNMHTHTLR